MILAHDIYAETNPVFCSFLLSGFCDFYNTSIEINPEIPLIYLVLPIVLSEDLSSTFLGCNIKTGLLVWLERNPCVLNELTKRVNSTLAITTEAIRFGCISKILKLNVDGTVVGNNIKLERLMKDNSLSLKKTRLLAYWFSEMGSTRATFEAMGLTL
ncbi:TPA: three component ABC system middle component [Klebsiella aerogenes]